MVALLFFVALCSGSAWIFEIKALKIHADRKAKRSKVRRLQAGTTSRSKLFSSGGPAPWIRTREQVGEVEVVPVPSPTSSVSGSENTSREGSSHEHDGSVEESNTKSTSAPLAVTQLREAETRTGQRGGQSSVGAETSSSEHDEDGPPPAPDPPAAASTHKQQHKRPKLQKLNSWLVLRSADKGYAPPDALPDAVPPDPGAAFLQLYKKKSRRRTREPTDAEQPATDYKCVNVLHDGSPPTYTDLADTEHWCNEARSHCLGNCNSGKNRAWVARKTTTSTTTPSSTSTTSTTSSSKPEPPRPVPSTPIAPRPSTPIAPRPTLVAPRPTPIAPRPTPIGGPHVVQQSGGTGTNTNPVGRADEHDKQSGCWKAHHWAILGAAIGGVVFCFILGFLVFTHIDERDSSNLSEGEIEERLDRGMPLPVQYLDMRARVSEDTAALKPAMSFKSDAEYFHSKEEQQRRSFKSGATAAGLTRVTPTGTTSAKGKKAELGSGKGAPLKGRPKRRASSRTLNQSKLSERRSSIQAKPRPSSPEQGTDASSSTSGRAERGGPLVAAVAGKRYGKKWRSKVAGEGSSTPTETTSSNEVLKSGMMKKSAAPESLKSTTIIKSGVPGKSSTSVSLPGNVSIKSPEPEDRTSDRDSAY